MLQQHRVQLSELGVTPIQAAVLLYLQYYPGSYRQSVADDLGRGASWIGVVVRELHRHGWLKKQRAPCDDSYVLLTVTRKGTALARTITRDVLLRLGEPAAR